MFESLMNANDANMILLNDDADASYSDAYASLSGYNLYLYRYYIFELTKLYWLIEKKYN